MFGATAIRACTSCAVVPTIIVPNNKQGLSQNRKYYLFSKKKKRDLQVLQFSIT